MTLPDPIGPILPEGNSMDGLISKIREIIHDPVSSGIVTATTSGQSVLRNSNDTILSSETTEWSSTSTANAYIQFDFHEHFVFPTHYSFRGRSGYTYARSWYFYGFNGGEETDNSKWFLLGDNTSEGTNYCEPLDGYYCGNYNIGTFTVIPSNKGFRYFRWILKQCSSSSYDYIALRGIELFGTLSSNPYFSTSHTTHLSRYECITNSILVTSPNLIFIFSLLSLFLSSNPRIIFIFDH